MKRFVQHNEPVSPWIKSDIANIHRARSISNNPACCRLHQWHALLKAHMKSNPGKTLSIVFAWDDKQFLAKLLLGLEISVLPFHAMAEEFVKRPDKESGWIPQSVIPMQEIPIRFRIKFGPRIYEIISCLFKWRLIGLPKRSNRCK